MDDFPNLRALGNNAESLAEKLLKASDGDTQILSRLNSLPDNTIETFAKDFSQADDILAKFADEPELVKAWEKAIGSGDDDLIKAINSLKGDADELENVLRHVDDIDAAGGYKVWRGIGKLIKNKLPISLDGKLLGEIIEGRFVMSGSANAAGDFDFIVTADGRTLLGRKHSFLSGGADVKAAGTLKIRNGEVVNVTNLSGHYAPNLEQSEVFLDILRKSGVNVSKAHLKIYDESGKLLKHILPK